MDRRALLLFFAFATGFSISSAAAGEDLSISRAVDMAVAYSPLLRAMQAGARVAREQVGVARALKRPTVTLSVTGSRLNSPMRVFGAKLDQQRITMADFDPGRLNHPAYESHVHMGLQITQPLYLAGIDRNALAAARAGEQVSRLEVEQALQETIYRTIEAYLQAVLARERVAVAGKAVEASGESVRNALAAHEAMQAVEADVHQARVHHAQNEESLLRQRNQHRLAREALATLMGVPCIDGFELSMPFLQQVCEPCQDDPRDLLRKALAQRLDYRKLALEHTMLVHQRKKALGRNRPHVAVGAAL